MAFGNTSEKIPPRLICSKLESKDSSAYRWLRAACHAASSFTSSNSAELWLGAGSPSRVRENDPAGIPLMRFSDPLGAALPYLLGSPSIEQILLIGYSLQAPVSQDVVLLSS